MRTLTRSNETGRVRQIKPGEDVVNLWVSEQARAYECISVRVNLATGKAIEGNIPTHHEIYTEAHVEEDRILFPETLSRGYHDHPFHEMKNGISRVEMGIIPSNVRYVAKIAEAFRQGHDMTTAMDVIGAADKDSIIALPQTWRHGLKELYKTLTMAQLGLLIQTGIITSCTKQQLLERLDTLDPDTIMARDTAIGKYSVDPLEY